MKTNAPLFIVIACLFSCICFAQRQSLRVNAKMENAQFMSDGMSNDQLVVVAYHVEERINMKFGGGVTTYNVSSLSLVRTNNLGPDNTRIVTPVYAKTRAKTPVTAATVAPAIVQNELPKAIIAVHAPVAPVKTAVSALEKKQPVAYIDIAGTYERILNKGYKSVEMLKKVANSKFFEGDLAKSAQWYAELFSLTTDLGAEYYYRYAKSLKFIGQTEKANEMMKIFEQKNL
jgi:hypothetical protein